MKEVLTGIGTAVGLAIAGFVIQLIREQTKRIKDDRLRKTADDIVHVLEQLIPQTGAGSVKKLAAESLLENDLPTAASIIKNSENVNFTKPIAVETTKGKVEPLTGVGLVIEAAVHRMKIQEDK